MREKLHKREDIKNKNDIKNKQPQKGINLKADLKLLYYL